MELSRSSKINSHLLVKEIYGFYAMWIIYVFPGSGLGLVWCESLLILPTFLWALSTVRWVLSMSAYQHAVRALSIYRNILLDTFVTQMNRVPFTRSPCAVRTLSVCRSSSLYRFLSHMNSVKIFTHLLCYPLECLPSLQKYIHFHFSV